MTPAARRRMEGTGMSEDSLLEVLADVNAFLRHLDLAGVEELPVGPGFSSGAPGAGRTAARAPAEPASSSAGPRLSPAQGGIGVSPFRGSSAPERSTGTTTAVHAGHRPAAPPTVQARPDDS